MGKIGDLWVKLGLKNDEFKAGMAEAKKEAEGFGSSVGAVAGKAKALWFAVGAAATKMALDFVQSTQRMGDAWDRTIGACKAGWNQFINSLARWDWEGFGQRMRNAMSAAADAVSARDMTFEVQNSINIRKAAMREELADLQIAARNQKLSYKEREQAAKDYLGKVETFYNEVAALRSKLMLTETNDFLGAAGLSGTAANRAALESFLVNAAPNSALVEALDKYSRHAQGKKHGTLTADEIKAIDDFLAQYDYSTQGVMLSLANYYQNGIGGKNRDEKVQKVVDAIANAYAASGAFKDESKRMFSMLNAAGAASAGGLSDVAAEVQPAIADATKIMEALEAAEAKREADAKARAERMAEYWRQETEAFAREFANAEDDIQPTLDAIQDDIVNALNPPELREGMNLGEMMGDFLDSAIDGLVDSTQELADALMSVGEIDGDKLFKALLDPMFDTAKQMGALMIKMAAGMIALETSIENPALLLAAGAALVALASAGKAAIAATVSGNASAAGTTSTAAVPNAENVEMTIHIEGKLKGSDIVLAGQKASAAWAR